MPPQGFHKVRYFGICSPANRDLLKWIQQQLQEENKAEVILVAEGRVWRGRLHDAFGFVHNGCFRERDGESLKAPLSIELCRLLGAEPMMNKHFNKDAGLRKQIAGDFAA
jgi:hypothetical protein